jgi:recombination protein RecT
VLTACDRESVAAALLDMVVRGLNPIKKQCYFIAYGKHLACQRSYFGSMAVAKAVQPKIDDFAYAVVYENDVFEYGIDRGKKYVIKHEQKLENVNKANIAAAYCIALNVEGDPYRSEIMTIDEIKQAWKQSQMNPIDEKGNVKSTSTHGKFTADMAMKTVINKLCKGIINASSDNALLLDTIKKNQDLADRASAEAEIEAEANTGEMLDITPPEEEEAAPDQPPDPPQEQEKPEEAPKQAQGQNRVPGF